MNAIELLKNDHRRVEELFADHEKAGENAHTEKRAIGDRIFNALDVHTQIEEEIFYPAARDGATTENDTLVAEAIEEHQVVKGLIADLRGAHPGDEQWDAKMKVLQESVEHHVKEEEGQLFPRTRTALGADYLEELGQTMSARKRELASDESIGTSLVKLVTRAYDSLTGATPTKRKRRAASTRAAKPARARAARRAKKTPSRPRTAAKSRSAKRAASRASGARSAAARARKAATRAKKRVSTGRTRTAKVVKRTRRTVKAQSARR